MSATWIEEDIVIPWYVFALWERQRIEALRRAMRGER